MKNVRALTSFEHDGSHQKGDEWEVTNATADELARANLVEIVSEKDGDEEPEADRKKASGKKKSGSD